MRWMGEGAAVDRPWLTDPLAPAPALATEVPIMAQQTAPADGTYTLGAGRFRIAEGAPLPEGATFEAGGDAPAKTEKRAKAKPAENRAKADAPETRAGDKG